MRQKPKASKGQDWSLTEMIKRMCFWQHIVQRWSFPPLPLSGRAPPPHKVKFSILRKRHDTIPFPSMRTSFKSTFLCRVLFQCSAAKIKGKQNPKELPFGFTLWNFTSQGSLCAWNLIPLVEVVTPPFAHAGFSIDLTVSVPLEPLRPEASLSLRKTCYTSPDSPLAVLLHQAFRMPKTSQNQHEG